MKHSHEWTDMRVYCIWFWWFPTAVWWTVM